MMDSNDAIQERRRDPNNQAVVMLIHDLTEQVKELKAAVTEMKRANAYTHGVTQEFLDKAVTHALSAAFPDGDADGHRRHHEAVIKASEARAEFWTTMAKEVAKYGLVSLVGFLAIAAWQVFLRGPSK
jgi:hypothetical protein